LQGGDHLDEADVQSSDEAAGVKGPMHLGEVLIGEGPGIPRGRSHEARGDLLGELIVDDGYGLYQRLLDVVIEQPAQFRALEGHKRSRHGRSLAPMRVSGDLPPTDTNICSITSTGLGLQRRERGSLEASSGRAEAEKTDGEEPVSGNEEKFAELLLCVAKRTAGDSTVGSSKLNKLLYFAEFSSVRMTGMPITGVEYQRLDNGSAPRRLLPIRGALIQDGAAELQHATVFGFAQQRLVALRKPDMSQFSSDEIEIIDQVVDLLWGKSATELREILRREMGWRMVGDRETIPYESALIRSPRLTEEIRSQAQYLAEQFHLV
jgi:uncharacterized phage-associated protein